jgi:hypothetical protein
LLRFLDFLKKEEQRLRMKIGEVINGKTKSKKKIKYKCIMNVIKNLESYENSELLSVLASLIEIKT